MPLNQVNTPTRNFCVFLAAVYKKDDVRVEALKKNYLKRKCLRILVLFLDIFDALDSKDSSMIQKYLNQILAYHHSTVSHHRARDYNQPESFVCLYVVGILQICELNSIDISVNNLKSTFSLSLPVYNINEVQPKRPKRSEIDIDYLFLLKKNHL